MSFPVILALALLASSAVAQLRFEVDSLKLPATISDRQIIATFRFSNAGHQTVRIIGLASSCSCTSVESEKLSYAPGETGEIRATFAIADRVGEQHKSVFVDTDHPGQERIELRFATTIPSWAELEPKFLTWKPEQGLEPKSLAVKISPGHLSFTANCPSAALETKFEQRAGQDCFRLTVTPKESKLRALVTLRGEYPGGISKVATVFISVP